MNLEQYMAEEIYKAMVRHVTWDDVPVLPGALVSPLDFYRSRAEQAVRLAGTFMDLFKQGIADD